MDISQEQVEKINSLIADRVEYEEEHQDSGDAYYHMLGESWHSEHDRRLADQLAELKIDLGAVDFDQLAEDVIFWAEMVPSHIYDAAPRPGTILLDSYMIGEIEIEISAEELGIAELSSAICDQLSRSCDAYFSHCSADRCFAYVSSDRSWDSQISAETVRDLIADLADRAA
jgi:hypothetical protein